MIILLHQNVIRQLFLSKPRDCDYFRCGSFGNQLRLIQWPIVRQPTLSLSPFFWMLKKLQLSGSKREEIMQNVAETIVHANYDGIAWKPIFNQVPRWLTLGEHAASTAIQRGENWFWASVSKWNEKSFAINFSHLAQRLIQTAQRISLWHKDFRLSELNAIKGSIN